MAREAKITILVDNAQALAGAGAVDRAVDGIGDSAKKAADKLDRELSRGFASAGSSAKSFVSGALSSFVGNIGANVFGAATRAAQDFFTGSIESAVKATDATRFLASAVREAGGNLEAAKAQAAAFAAQMGLSNSEAERFLAVATLRTKGTGTDPVTFFKAVADSAAAAGQSLKGIDLNSLFTSDDLLNRLGLPDPSSLQAAFKTKNNISGDLTDDQKTQSILDAVIAKGAANAGAAASRAGDLGGQLDGFNAKIENIEANFGKLVARNEGVRLLMDTMNQGLTQALAGSQNLAESQSRVASVFGEIAASVTLVGGRMYEFFTQAGFFTDALAQGILEVPKQLAVAFASMKVMAIESVNGLREVIKDFVPESVANKLGLGGNLDNSVFGARAEQTGAQADLKAFQEASDKMLGDRLTKMESIRRDTDAAVERARAFGKNLGTFAPEAAPGASPAPKPAAVASPTLEPGESIIATGPDGTSLISSGSYEDGTLSFRSWNPKDGIISKAGVGVGTGFAGPIAAIAEKKKAEALAKAADTRALAVRSLDDLALKVSGRDRANGDSDLDRLFNDARGGGLYRNEFGDVLGTAGIDSDAAQARLVEAAKSGKIDFDSLTSGQRDVLQTAIEGEKKRAQEEKDEEKASRTENTKKIGELTDEVKSLKAEIAKGMKAEISVTAGKDTTVDGFAPLGSVGIL